MMKRKCIRCVIHTQMYTHIIKNIKFYRLGLNVQLTQVYVDVVIIPKN